MHLPKKVRTWVNDCDKPEVRENKHGGGKKSRLIWEMKTICFLLQNTHSLARLHSALWQQI